jgi:hypothetical protein
VPGLFLSAVLLAMACVKADRGRAWRTRIGPSAPELPDGAFVLPRILFVTSPAMASARPSRASASRAACRGSTVTADGTDVSFCTHTERSRTKKDDYSPPGLTGGEGSLTYRGYRIGVTTQKGEC